jgi:succinyl-CoA reductase
MRAIIGDREVSSQKVIEVRNPANGEVIDTVPSLDLDQVREAIDVAYDSQEKLLAMGVAKRSRALLQIASFIRENLNDLAVLMTREAGRPIKSSRAEIERTAQIFELVAVRSGG